MPSTISKARLRKAFNEGRRSAARESVANPYDNAKLHRLWEDGRAQQRAGTLTTPIPPLEPGERRAERVPQNPPGSARPTQPPCPRRPGGGPAPADRRDRAGGKSALPVNSRRPLWPRIGDAGILGRMANRGTAWRNRERRRASSVCTDRRRRNARPAGGHVDPLRPCAPGRVRLPAPRPNSAGEEMGSAKKRGHVTPFPRSVVAAHGGTIDVTNSAEAGTVFTVRLPRKPATS